MSTAEIAAHNIYDTYNLGALPQDVKRHLMILLLSEQRAPDSLGFDDFSVSVKEELCSRAETALQQIKAGEGRPIDELLDEVDSKYPELCK